MTCGSLEMEIMNSVWNMLSENEDREISVQDVADFMTNNGVQRAYTTVKTVMDRLAAKGVLARYKNGKKFFYNATLNKKEMATEAVDKLVNQFFGGSRIEFLRFIEKECDRLLI